ncbi:MAG TPA: hypothetical protein PKY82_00895 [Pyrinomonadaceae bacterium]|nr:hypothetical protein [Pyrinomonadaceae bacterium]
MKNLIILTILFLLFVSFVPAQTKKCFKNNGLKDGHTVYLTLNGNQISGEFIVMREYQNEEKYNFSGTNLNNNLSVSFADNRLPYQMPPKAKKGNWVLRTVDNVESLQIKTYGQNYETNKWSTYLATYESCDPSFEFLAKSAKRISFARGATSATAEFVSDGKTVTKSFWLNLGKGQKFSIEAPGCGISFFYPNKTKYEEGTAIDIWGSESLPQSGDYLFIFSWAGEANKCNIKFSTK